MFDSFIKRYSLWFLLLLPLSALASELMPRDEFVRTFVPNMTQKLCDNPNSPFVGIYAGKPADCQGVLNSYVSACAKKVVPDAIDPQQQGMQSIIVMSQCLMATYQGGDVLRTFDQQLKKSFSIEKADWLKTLQPVMEKSMCEQTDSDFGKAYQGDQCQQDVARLFQHCTTRVPNVVIPDAIDSLSKADHHGQVIAACITAHYVGGDALRSFQSMRVN